MTRKEDLENLLTIKEAAAYLKMHEWTVRELINTKRLPAAYLGRRSIRIRPEDVEGFFQKNLIK